MSQSFKLQNPSPVWQIKTRCGRHTLNWFEVRPGQVAPVVDDLVPTTSSVLLFGRMDENGKLVEFFAPFTETIVNGQAIPMAFAKNTFRNDIPNVLRVFDETFGGAA